MILNVEKTIRNLPSSFPFFNGIMTSATLKAIIACYKELFTFP